MSIPHKLEYIDQLRVLFEAKQYEKGLDLVIIEKQKRPNDPDLLYLEALFLGLLNRDETLEASDLAISVDPKNPANYQNKGIFLYHRKDYREAIKAFDECLKLAPLSFLVIQKKISSLLHLGKYESAHDVYIGSDLPEVEEDRWCNDLGYMYLQLGDHEKALQFFLLARKIDPFEIVYVGNLILLHKRRKQVLPLFKYVLVYFRLSFLGTFGVLRKIKSSVELSEIPHMSSVSFFGGPGKLFSSKKQKETRAIFKILRSPNAMALCNDWWRWFAVNIPYNVADKKTRFKGDIDLIVKRSVKDRNGTESITYRGFEIKTTTVSKLGEVKSAKRGPGKHKRIEIQLEVLKEFGCEQVFFLEVFILERGYSLKHSFPSLEIKKEIEKKIVFLKDMGVGYVVMAEEPSVSHDDETGGIMHPPINVLSTRSNQITSDFLGLVGGIERAFKEALVRPDIIKSQVNPYGVIISYCRACDKLVPCLPVSYTSHICPVCDSSLYLEN